MNDETLDIALASLLEEADQIEHEKSVAQTDPHEIAFGEIMAEKYQKMDFKICRFATPAHLSIIGEKQKEGRSTRMSLSKTEELDKHLRKLFVAHSTDTLLIRPDLDEQEAADFLTGFKAGLFNIDDLGYAQSTLLDAMEKSQIRQQVFQLFWHKSGGKRFLFREGVCQLAAVSALVLHYGWPREQVYLDPGKATVKGLAYAPNREKVYCNAKGKVTDLSYAVDLMVTDGAMGQVIICGEAKGSIKELDELIRQFSDCCQRGAHSEAECKNTQHPKFEACWRLQPYYFWIVCPGRRQAFKLSYQEERVTLLEIDDLPYEGFL